MDGGCVSVCCLPKWLLLLQCCVWHKGGCSSSLECRQWGAEISKCYQLPNLPFSTLSRRGLSLLHSCWWQQGTGNILLKRFVCAESLYSLFLPFAETWHQILPPPAPQPLPSLQRCCANLTNANLALAVWPKLVLGAGFHHIQVRQAPRAVLWHSQVITGCHRASVCPQEADRIICTEKHFWYRWYKSFYRPRSCIFLSPVRASFFQGDWWLSYAGGFSSTA